MRFVLSFLLLIASGLFWVWVRVEHIKTAYHINDLQNQLMQLDETERLLEVERASLRRPDRLRRMAKKQFQMHAPRVKQVINLGTKTFKRLFVHVDSNPFHWLASKWRYRCVFAFVTFGFLLAVLKAASLQLSHGDALRGLAEKQYKRTLQVSSARGMIYDREGRTLAGSVPMESVYAEPRHIEDKVDTILKLAEILNVPEKKLRKRLMGDRSFAWVKRRVSPKLIEQVKELKLRGIGFLKEHRRYYPNHSVAGQLLGTVSIDGEGQGGIEQALNKELRPKALQKSVLRDARGNRLITNTGFELDYFRGG